MTVASVTAIIGKLLESYPCPPGATGVTELIPLVIKSTSATSSVAIVGSPPLITAFT